jgi:hypothetical protein
VKKCVISLKYQERLGPSEFIIVSIISVVAIEEGNSSDGTITQ